MKLAGNEVGVVGQFDNLDEAIIEGRATNYIARFEEDGAVAVVKFVAVTVPLGDDLILIKAGGQRVGQ